MLRLRTLRYIKARLYRDSRKVNRVSVIQLGREDCVKRDQRKAEEKEKLREKAKNREQWKK